MKNNANVIKFFIIFMFNILYYNKKNSSIKIKLS